MPRIDTPVTANSHSLERILKTGLPTLLILFNNKRTMLPQPLENAMKTLAREAAQQVLVVKIDVGDSPEVAQRFAMSSGLLAVRDGREIARYTRLDAQLMTRVADYLLGKSSTLPEEAPTGHAAPVHVSDSSFPDMVLNSPTPVLVDFWAEWCGPCHMIAPTLEKLAAEYAGRLTIAKLNVDQNQRTAQQFQIQGIPALLLFKNGRMEDKLVGAAPEPTLRSFLERHL